MKLRFSTFIFTLFHIHSNSRNAQTEARLGMILKAGKSLLGMGSKAARSAGSNPFKGNPFMNAGRAGRAALPPRSSNPFLGNPFMDAQAAGPSYPATGGRAKRSAGSNPFLGNPFMDAQSAEPSNPFLEARSIGSPKPAATGAGSNPFYGNPFMDARSVGPSNPAATGQYRCYLFN